MQTDQFEKAFSDFLDRDAYDEVETSLFNLVRTTFKAGWEAAGGEAPHPDSGLRLFTPKDKGKSK